jgi:phosphoglycerate kinase
MAKYKTLDDFQVKDKVVLVRVDFNSEIDPNTKKVTSDVRIRAHAESTIKELAEKGAKTVILAHQGRKGDPDYTPLKEHAKILGTILKCPVKFVDDVFGDKAKAAIKALKGGEVLVLENVRSWDGETKSKTPEEAAKTELVQNLAPLADLFVNDAFAAAHRGHVSMVGFTAVLPSAAGRIMERELKSLAKALEKPEHPCVYVMGGAKADDSLEISKYVLGNGIADYVLVGGVTSQLFLAAKGVDLGKKTMGFLAKKELTQFMPGIKELLAKYPDKIILPEDVALENERKSPSANCPPSTAYSTSERKPSTNSLTSSAKQNPSSSPDPWASTRTRNSTTAPRKSSKPSPTAKPSASQAAATQSQPSKNTA